MPYRKRLIGIVYAYTDNSSYLTFLDYVRTFSERYDISGTISIESFLVRHPSVKSATIQLISGKYLVFRPYPILQTDDYWLEDGFSQFQVPKVLQQFPVIILTGQEAGTYEYTHD